jgi:hypothetical protein
MKWQEERDNAERERRNTPASRIKLFGQTLQNTLPKMPSDPIELISFFETVEDLFKKFDIPPDIQTTLLRPHLSEKARSLLTRVDTAISSDFAAVRKFLLEQFHLTPLEYKKKFNTATGQSNESYLLFANRLKLLLEYYIRSRSVERETLMN